MTKNKLYILLSAACIAGYSWLYFSNLGDNNTEVCLFKQFTNLPCPSCGSTRAVLQLFHGNFRDAFYLNPLGYLIIALLLIIPLWITADLITAKATLSTFYQKAECFIKQKQIAIPLILVILVNWVWNIYKSV